MVYFYGKQEKPCPGKDDSWSGVACAGKRKLNYERTSVMAKAIKFNLICDKQPVRTIEDLQNNFSIEDVMEYYHNRLLHRWLEVRGYEEELTAVNAISSGDSFKIAKELIRIFNVAADGEKIEESLYMLSYLKEREKRCALYDQEDYQVTQIIEEYAAGYSQCVASILRFPDDAALIKATIGEMARHYPLMLETDHRNLFYTLAQKSPLAIMCLLMNQETRDYYLSSCTSATEKASKTDAEDDGYDGYYSWMSDFFPPSAPSSRTVEPKAAPVEQSEISQSDKDKNEMFNNICNNDWECRGFEKPGRQREVLLRCHVWVLERP